jgi:2-polyprenyl-6-methoxyphenol hydroxylase-like FAD-dependent oxidoreductase
MMRVTILGAGPAGLYLSYLLKRRRPDIDVRVVEQNSPDATFGFGVVFSDRALEFLREDDADTYSAIAPHLEAWQDITVSHRGERVNIEGVGFAAIGRLHLLQILRERAHSVGIDPVYRRAVASPDELGEADLIVGADGVNSLVRSTFADEFGTIISYFNNRFAWFGTTRRFETLTQTFQAGPFGYFNAHHYRYSAGMSTFIVETDQSTFASIGFDRMDEEQSKTICEGIFAKELGGHPLVANRSIWRQFPRVSNERWWHRNCVLVGDALRTAHFSIGSGTRLAMEDVIALDRSLQAHHDNVSSALPAYEAARRPIVEKLVKAANASAEWYERFAEHMQLAPLDFVMSYLTRSGRVDRERLRAVSPAFVAQYEAAQSPVTLASGGRA